MERTFSFTVKLSHSTYSALLEESKQREGDSGAVPSRTARQMIEERLKEINSPVAPVCLDESVDEDQTLT